MFRTVVLSVFFLGIFFPVVAGFDVANDYRKIFPNGLNRLKNKKLIQKTPPPFSPGKLNKGVPDKGRKPVTN